VDGDQIPDETIDHMLTWLPGDAPRTGRSAPLGGGKLVIGRQRILGVRSGRMATQAHVAFRDRASSYLARADPPFGAAIEVSGVVRPSRAE